jgi:hypothetical protein
VALFAPYTDNSSSETLTRDRRQEPRQALLPLREEGEQETKTIKKQESKESTRNGRGID